MSSLRRGRADLCHYSFSICAAKMSMMPVLWVAALQLHSDQSPSPGEFFFNMFNIRGTSWFLTSSFELIQLCLAMHVQKAHLPGSLLLDQLPINGHCDSHMCLLESIKHKKIVSKQEDLGICLC